MAHAEVRDLFHGGASKFAAAEAAEMFATAMGESAEIGERPVASGFGGDGVPDFWEAIIDMPGLGETEDVELDQFHPMMEGGGLGLAELLVVEAEDRVSEGFGGESGENRGSGGSERTVACGGVIADPGENPAVSRDGMKGVEDVSRSEARNALAARFPFAIDEDGAESGAGGEEVASGEISTDHGVGHGGVGDPDMGDMVRDQGLAFRSAHNPFAGACADAVCLDERRMIHGVRSGGAGGSR